MVENTDGVRRKPADPARLDETDRKLLGLLAEDATRSYAELGRLLHLSAPAVHERAKRLRQEGVIRATAAVLGAEPNGSARASEGWHVPLIRMSNTFFLPGETPPDLKKPPRLGARPRMPPLPASTWKR